MEHYPIAILPPSRHPSLLQEIPDPPKKLFVRGSMPQGDFRYLTVVGSRHPSEYSTHVVKSLIQGLRGYPIVIVSGLALGIDGMAHEAALDAHLPTIAVPGSGLSDTVLYPRTHRALAYHILKSNGALISEYEPDFRATVWSFPARNRIMAGMAHATLIIEAKERSGTLITTRLALEYNREVLAVPGSIFARGSFGPHMLIREGATPVRTSEDILEILKLQKKEIQNVDKDLTPEEQKLISLLDTPLDKDTLIRHAHIKTHHANTLLSLLELKGYIQEHNGIVSRTITP